MHPWGSIQNVDTGSIYVSIQKAINAPETENGDTIKVKADTYYEHMVVNKSLTLIGEDPSTTIVDGKSTGNVVTVQANNVRISGFMIQNGDYGIYLDEYSNGNTIGGNTISNNGIGVYLSQNTENNTVSDNVVSNNDLEGIFAESSDGNSIYRNTVSNNGNGITLSSSDSNFVNHNKVLNNYGNGITLLSSSNNALCENTVSNNAYGIYLKISRDNAIHHNNFINNTEQIRLIGSQSNTWHSINLVGNYWNDYNGNDTNGDGIGDTLLPHQGVDSYPLMWKWFPGDLDGDGDVDSFDFGIFSGAYGSQMGDPNYNPIADLDYDGDMDPDDFIIFAGNYGKQDQ